MDKYFPLVIALVGAFVLWSFIKNTGNAGIVKISPADAKKRLDSDAGIILLDVRTMAEYLDNHIPKSISLPLNEIATEAPRKLPDKEAEIFVYCQSGSRSIRAAKMLLKMGYSRVYNLGGIVRWPYKTVSGKK